MKPARSAPRPSLGQHQQSQQRDEFRAALRALLMTPLMPPGHEAFVAVRRQAQALREWFARETGWTLQVEREGARLFKRPADLMDASRGLPGYDARRYALLCLACAVLDRADAQITLRLLGERLLLLAAEPALAARGFHFTLSTQTERRELVAVCRSLLALGVLQRVAGDEEGFAQVGNEQADALYDLHRRALAGVLAAVRGPSTWPALDAPTTLQARLHALTAEHVVDSDEARRTALRHQLSRQLLDDPVVYANNLAPDARAYFINQRGALANRLCEASGLLAEQRAEGLALVDEASELTDTQMPAEGTDAHATLLVAEMLATAYRDDLQAGAGTTSGITSSTPAAPRITRELDIVALLREAKETHGRYWRKSAREPGAERELASVAIDRLARLQLIRVLPEGVIALPALARFALAPAGGGAAQAAQAAGLPLTQQVSITAAPPKATAVKKASAAPRKVGKPSAPAAPINPNKSLFD